jgi:hypothetical protein
LIHAPDKNLQRLVERFGEREHLQGAAVYDASGKALAITPGITPVFQSWPDRAKDAASKDAPQDEFTTLKSPDSFGKRGVLELHIHAVPLHRQ